jgi:hypothetical protein
MAVVVAGEH